MNTVTAARVAPVEYAVAVDRYLAESRLNPSSRRVYKISLAGWAWPLVDRVPPAGRSRWRASPPVVPLALLEHRDAGRRLAEAVAYRIRHAGLRTVSREVSALRSAIGWWQRQQWISADPTAALGRVGDRPQAASPLTAGQVAALFRSPAPLREQVFWHLLRDSGASADAILALDAAMLDLSGRRARLPGGEVRWRPLTGDLLGWLLAGRQHGPVFLTDRRAPATTSRADLCPLSGRGRMSYRRTAEIFTEHTKALDPAGKGWTLHQLRGSQACAGRRV